LYSMDRLIVWSQPLYFLFRPFSAATTARRDSHAIHVQDGHLSSGDLLL